MIQCISPDSQPTITTPGIMIASPNDQNEKDDEEEVEEEVITVVDLSSKESKHAENVSQT